MMKRLLVTALTLPLLLAGCGKDDICAQNDADCDGVPDDLGRAIDTDGEFGAEELKLCGKVVGFAVDLNCDNKWTALEDGIGLDQNNDGYVDSVGFDQNNDCTLDSVDPSGAPYVISTGSTDAIFDCANGGGSVDLSGGGTPVVMPNGDGDGDLVTPGDGDGVNPGDGDGDVVNPGDGDGDVVNPGDGDGDMVIDDGLPEVDLGDWKAPIVSNARLNLAVEFIRWKNSYLKDDCGGGKSSVPNGDGGVYSEGMGYGMLIMAGLGTQAEFDSMYATYRDAPKTGGGLMRWECNECATSCYSDQAASDGDLDAAMALLQAEARFGGGTYRSAGASLIGKLRSAVLKNCGGGTHIVPGEWDPNCENLNPSYFAPGYYRAFAAVDTGGASQWNASINSAYGVFEQSKSNGLNGMWPDGIGGSNFSGNGNDGCRVPWRIAIDYAWSGDTRASSLMGYVQGKVDASGYAALSTNTNSAFYGALATSGLAGGQAKADAYYSTWIGSNPLHDNQYYQATLRLIYLMLMAGQFPSTL